MKPIFPLLSLILLSGMAFAQYSSPPLSLLIGNNTAAAAALDGYYNSSYAQNGTANLSIGNFSRLVNLSASVVIVGLSPNIGNISCVSEDIAVVIARGYYESHLLDPYGEDFDHDQCTEIEGQTIARYNNLNITFSFRNTSETVPFDSTFLSLPPSILDALESSSGTENLTINVTGIITFIFQIDNPPQGDCDEHNYTNISGILPISVNQTFLVGGNQKLVFLVRPILREQWFRDNRFDTIVLSQCPLYRAEIRMNGASMKNISIRTFNLTTDEFGFMRMTSNLSDAGGNGWMEDPSAVATPTPLEMENNSFAYAYMFNFSYQGLGDNNLSIAATDSVLDSEEYNDTLRSRMLSYNGLTMENGQPVNGNSRPSASSSEGSLTRLEIGLGLVGLVLILAFLNFWVAR